MAYPNETAATATVIDINNLPEYGEVVISDAATMPPLWWRLPVTATPEPVIGFRWWGDIGTTWKTYTVVYLGNDDGSVLTYIGQVGNAFFEGNTSSQSPVPVGQNIFFQVVRVNGVPAGARTLHYDVIQAPGDIGMPAGMIMIRGASITPDQMAAGLTGLAAGIIDPATSSIVSLIPELIVGESGDILETSGIMAFGDEYGSLYPIVGFDRTIVLYNPNLTEIATTTFTVRASLMIRAVPGVERFYVMDGGLSPNAGGYMTVEPDGTASARQSVGTFGATAMAVNGAETIMYLSGVSGSNNSNIRTWDLVGLAYGADLAATVAGYRCRDLLVMADDSVVATYEQAVGNLAIFRRYSAAGALLNTYTPAFAATLSGAPPRLGSSSTAGAFWLLAHLSTGYNDIRLIRASDGVELEASLTPNTFYSTFETADPQLYVTSDTCPIIELRVEVEPPPEPPDPDPGFSIVTHTIRRLRRAPHLNTENTRVFYPGIELDFQRGIGILSDPGRDPEFMLRMSKDGGRTWGSEIKMQAGQVGQYLARAQAHRLGAARDAVFEVTVSDPVDWHLINAWLSPDPQAGTN